MAECGEMDWKRKESCRVSMGKKSAEVGPEFCSSAWGQLRANARNIRKVLIRLVCRVGVLNEDVIAVQRDDEHWRSLPFMASVTAMMDTERQRVQ